MGSYQPDGHLFELAPVTGRSGNSSRFFLDAHNDLPHCRPDTASPASIGSSRPGRCEMFPKVSASMTRPCAWTAAGALAPAPTKDSNPANVAAPSPGSQGSQSAQPMPSAEPPASMSAVVLRVVKHRAAIQNIQSLRRAQGLVI